MPPQILQIVLDLLNSQVGVTITQAIITEIEALLTPHVKPAASTALHRPDGAFDVV